MKKDKKIYTNKHGESETYIGFRTSPENYERLQSEAKEQKRSASSVVSSIVDEYYKNKKGGKR